VFELLDSYFCDIVQGFMGLARPIDYEEEKQNRSSVNFTYHYLYIFLHMNVLTKLVESRGHVPQSWLCHCKCLWYQYMLCFCTYVYVVVICKHLRLKNETNCYYINIYQLQRVQH